jgi:hypothetical protein
MSAFNPFSKNSIEDYNAKRKLWEILDGGHLTEWHDEEYWARRDAMTKWLVYYDHYEDGSFVPVALVEAQDEEEARLKALASGVRVPLALVEVQARRFTWDYEDGDSTARVIECADCGQSVESSNGVLCSVCLERFMAGDIDGGRMIAK